MHLTPYIDPSKMDRGMVQNVKNFIIYVAQNRPARWPGYSCLLWDEDKGTPLVIRAQSPWGRYANELYFGHDPSQPIPLWVPGALAAVARFFGIAHDPEVKKSIFDLGAKLIAEVFHPIQQTYAVETGSGSPVHSLAMNVNSKTIAVKFKMVKDENGEEGPRVTWRSPTGEEVEVDEGDEAWVIVDLETGEEEEEEEDLTGQEGDEDE